MESAGGGATMPKPFEPQEEPQTPKPLRKLSATARRQGQLDTAASILGELRDDLQATLDGWGDSFAGYDRSDRFGDAVSALEEVIEAVEAVDVSWNGGAAPP